MDIPNVNDRVWEDVLTGRKKCEFQFLAINLLLSRVRLAGDGNLTRDDIAVYSQRLRQIFIDYAKLPKIQNDLKQLTS